MDLKEIYDFFDYILRKERGIFITPPEKDALFHRAQMWLFTSFVPFYGTDQKVQDALSPFSVKFTYTSSSGGIVTLPTDETVDPCYQHLSSIWVQYFDNALSKTRYKPIKIISEDELPDRLNSQILEPTITDPVGLELSPGSIQLYPATTISGYGFYLKKPVKPLFSYTIGSDRRTIVYNPVTSTQLIWNDSSINKLIVKALQFAGVNMEDDMMIRYSEAKNTQDI